jgi:hypothetical protein
MRLEDGSGPEYAPRRRLGGLIVQKQRWGLSLPAKFLVYLLILGLSFVSIRGLYSFLALSDPVLGGVIAIEGWIHDINVEQTINRYDPTHDLDVYIINAVPPAGFGRESGRRHSEYIETKLKGAGVPTERVHLVFYEASNKDRTYHTALALKNWLRERGIPITSLNVVTTGAHARRSRLLFRKAFGDKIKIGVIPTSDLDYDPAHWWRSRAGVGHMIYQSFAYLYARFFFHP